MNNFSHPLIIPTAEPFFYQGDEVGCLLIHGFTGSPREMHLMGDYLHRYGWTVSGPRLPGHARFPQDMNHFKWQDWLATVEDAICCLRGHCSKIFVIGLSMGGMLAMIASAKYDVSGLVAISTPYSLPYERWMKFAPVIKIFKSMIDKGKNDWNDPSNGVGQIVYPGWPTAAISELLKLKNFTRNIEPLITAPALLVQSIHDSTVPEQHVHLHYRDLGSQDKSILLVQNSGHNIPRDTDREIVFEKTAQFIQRIIKA